MCGFQLGEAVRIHLEKKVFSIKEKFTLPWSLTGVPGTEFVAGRTISKEDCCCNNGPASVKTYGANDLTVLKCAAKSFSLAHGRGISLSENRLTAWQQGESMRGLGAIQTQGDPE